MQAPSTRRSSLSWLSCGMALLLVDIRRRWYLFLGLAAIWVLATVRVFCDHMPILPLVFNWSSSLPYVVAYADFDAGSYKRGDLILYSFHGPAGQGDFPELKDQPFFKRVVGTPGDTITVLDRDVYVNGVFVGRAKPYSHDRRPLAPIAPGLIPDGYLFAQGTSPDSFDSRYLGSGLVRLDRVKAKVHPIF